MPPSCAGKSAESLPEGVGSVRGLGDVRCAPL